VIAFLVFCLIAIAIAAVLYFQFSPAQQVVSPQPAPVSTPSQESERARQAEAMDAANFRADELAVVRERISAQLHAAKNIRDNIETLRKEISTWQDTVLPLMTNDQGKSVAADARSLQDFVALYQEELPPVDILDSFEARLTPLVDHLQTAGDVQDARVYRPTEEFIASRDALAADVREAITAYRRQNRMLAALLLRAPKSEPADGAPTLEATMSKLEQGRKIEDLKSISEELATLREENRKKVRDSIAEKETKIAEAEAEAERKLGELQSQKILSAVNEQMSNFEAEEQARLQEAKFQAALPEIQSYLAPFFEESFYQPTHSGPVKTGNKVPVSWKALQTSGALEPTEWGFAVLAMTINNASDRPKHGWDGGPSRDVLVRAQQLLKEFGPKLAEKGMLSP
jgi:hypothetical protein